ncbi:unnamed protein product [Strongylus vulgaris]|uniref:Uncharacterized protein n=1 Tax=Strongylus vulgaris TaxID=40348 RepID=A0A3P7K864_STRVU|nr:unnamed protein product [Strongylus vulgaris]
MAARQAERITATSAKVDVLAVDSIAPVALPTEYFQILVGGGKSTAEPHRTELVRLGIAIPAPIVVPAAVPLKMVA